MIFPFPRQISDPPDKAADSWLHVCSFDIIMMLAYVATIAAEGKHIGCGPLVIAAEVMSVAMTVVNKEKGSGKLFSLCPLVET